MTFTPGETRDPEAAAQVARAYRKLGRPVVLVPIRGQMHAGKAHVIRQARQHRGLLIVAGVEGVTGVDLLVRPFGCPPRTSIGSAALTETFRWLTLLRPTDLYLGERDYRRLIEVQHLVTDYHLGVRVHAVPTLRDASGTPVSSRRIDADLGAAVSAALTAGAHAAERGEEAVLAAARAVLDAGGVAGEIELLGGDLGEPRRGDARLFIRVGDYEDSAGVPLEIGFRNLQ